MTAFEMYAAVARDAAYDELTPDGPMDAYDRRGLLNLVSALLDERDAAIRRASELSEAARAYLDADSSPAYSWVDENQRERRGEPNREKERMAKVAAARAALRGALSNVDKLLR